MAIQVACAEEPAFLLAEIEPIGTRNIVCIGENYPFIFRFFEMSPIFASWKLFLYD